MIAIATSADGAPIKDITARAGVFNAEEVACVSVLWDDYLTHGPAVSGYQFIVEREGERVLGWACYGPRSLTTGVFDLYWIAVAPEARRAGVGRRLLEASEAGACAAGGRMLVAETSGTLQYRGTRQFYLDTGYAGEANIRDFYRPGDDLVIFIKRFQG